jgi:F-box/leucine-rich repeat protein 7
MDYMFSILSCCLSQSKIDPFLFSGDQVNGDRALSNILRKLCEQNNTCNVERVLLSDGCKVTDKGLQMISRRCPNITHLQIQFSVSVSNLGLFDFVTKCTNLQHLDLTGNLKNP